MLSNYMVLICKVGEVNQTIQRKQKDGWKVVAIAPYTFINSPGLEKMFLDELLIVMAKITD